jgi:ketosteroid isomerase-like protein
MSTNTARLCNCTNAEGGRDVDGDERSALEAKRLAIVLEHVEAENQQDLERAMATFHHARYEIMPTGDVADGDDAVRALLSANWAAMPGLRFSAAGVFHGPDGVVVETHTTGEHEGRPVDMMSVNLFLFEDDRLVCERCYFDQVTTAANLGG